MPNDRAQAAALATVMRDRGCTRIAGVSDGEVYGKGMATLVRRNASRLGLDVVAAARITRRARNFRVITRSKPDCVVYTGITANGAVRMFRGVGASRRTAQLFASDGVAETGFTSHLPASIARRMIVTVSTLAPDAYPGAAAIIGTGDPYKVYGYEAMKLILDGANAAGANKAAVLGWLRTVQNRSSVLGTYGFDANGDTTLRTYGLYTVRGRALSWVGPITAA